MDLTLILAPMGIEGEGKKNLLADLSSSQAEIFPLLEAFRFFSRTFFGQVVVQF